MPLLMIQVSAPYYIAFLEISWTAFTFATAGVKNTQQLYAVRFLSVRHVDLASPGMLRVD